MKTTLLKALPYLPVYLLKENPPETPDNFDCPLSNAYSLLKCLKCYCNMMLFSLFLGRRKVGIGHTIIVPMDIMSVLVAVSNASGTMKQTIIVMQEIGL